MLVTKNKNVPLKYCCSKDTWLVPSLHDCKCLWKGSFIHLQWLVIAKKIPTLFKNDKRKLLYTSIPLIHPKQILDPYRCVADSSQWPQVDEFKVESNLIWTHVSLVSTHNRKPCHKPFTCIWWSKTMSDHDLISHGKRVQYFLIFDHDWMECNLQAETCRQMRWSYNGQSRIC